MYALSEALHDMGLSAQAVKVTYNEYIELNRPGIAYVKGNHYVIFEKVLDGEVKVVEYPHIPTRMSFESLSRIWQGEILLLDFTGMEFKGPEIVASESHIDAGIVTPGSTPSLSFTIKNYGSENLKVEEVKPDCTCTVLDYKLRVISAGESDRVSFSYKFLPSESQKFDNSFSVYSNDPRSDEFEIRCAGIIDKKIYLYPSRLLLRKSLQKGGSIYQGDVKVFHFSDLDHELTVDLSKTNPSKYEIEVLEGEHFLTINVIFKGENIESVEGERVYLKSNIPGVVSVEIPIDYDVRPDLLVVPRSVHLGSFEAEVVSRIDLRVEKIRPYHFRLHEDEINLDLPGGTILDKKYTDAADKINISLNFNIIPFRGSQEGKIELFFSTEEEDLKLVVPIYYYGL